MNYYSAVKWTKLLINAIPWMHFKRIMLNEGNQAQKSTYYVILFIEESETCGWIYSGSRSGLPQSLRDKEMWQRGITKQHKVTLEIIGYVCYLYCDYGFIMVSWIYTHEKVVKLYIINTCVFTDLTAATTVRILCQ